jgi:cyclopropane fatty-acyl-phospholipid synthase-like methyltransferase
MIFQLLRLQRSDCYLDLGAGVGNTVLQASYTVGCEARGLEMVKHRYTMGLQLQNDLEDLLLVKSKHSDDNVCATLSLLFFKYACFGNQVNQFFYMIGPTNVPA